MHSQKLLQYLPVKVAHRPSQDFHNTILPMKHIELHRHIIPQDAQRIRDLLCIQPHLSLELLLLILSGFLTDVFMDSFASFHSVLPRC